VADSVNARERLNVGTGIFIKAKEKTFQHNRQIRANADQREIPRNKKHSFRRGTYLSKSKIIP